LFFLLIIEPFRLACPGGKAGSKVRGKAINNNTFLQLVGYCEVPLPDSRDDQGGGHDTTIRRKSSDKSGERGDDKVVVASPQPQPNHKDRIEEI
jgi:hypothetical protein